MLDAIRHPELVEFTGFRLKACRNDVNRYLKWAYVEAAHSVCLQRGKFPLRHGSRLYERIRKRKGHPKAIGAVARHLAEATFHVLTRGKPYCDPGLKAGRSREV